MSNDVIIIGGSYAGMAAALQLLRARRTVLVIDAGQRRSRAAAHSHGFLAQDGADPAELARTARAQLMAYPTITWIDGEAEAATGIRDAFEVAALGRTHGARRLLFAVGVSDELPDVAGLQARWGRSVFHCPYCHGYELDRGRIGVIATGAMSLHQAQMLAEWGTTTLLTNGALDVDVTAAADLAQRGVAVESRRIAQLDGHADVVFADGTRETFAGLFTAPRNKPATAIAERLGCTLAETPFGTQLWTSDTKEASVRGAYACGDAARIPHSLSLAVADGAWAGAQIHRSLVWPDG